MFKLCFTNQWNNFEDTHSCEWDVVQLSVTHKEGHVAKASLVVGKFTPPKASYMAIFDGDALLFQGMVSGQFEHHQHLTKVQILGISPTFEADFKKLLREQSQFYNPAFFQHSSAKPSDYLESRNMLFYWNRTSCQISLSNYFQGSRCVDVSGKYIDTSKMHQISMPLGRVVIELKVHWVQQLDGVFNGAPYIARAFPEKVIATLTPDGLQNNWPIDDQRLGMGKRQSGYRVEHSRITPTQIQGFREYTKPISTKLGDTEKSLRTKIHYFKTILKIHWHYHQPRIEEIQLQGQLNHIQHRFTQHRVHHIPIAIELPISQQAIFFETRQGIEFIEYASKIMKCQLRASARCIQVMCTLPWDLGRDLTIDDSLKADGKFEGKITMVRHVVKGLSRFVEVTIGCVIEPGDLVNGTTNSTCDYAQEPWNTDIHSNDSLSGITAPKLYPKNLITQIIVKNSAREQEAYLLQNQYPIRDNMNAVLQEVPTSIHIELRDLRTNTPLTRRFEGRFEIIDVPKIQPTQQ